MHRQHVGLFEQFLLADVTHANLRRPLCGEVFTPGDHAHAEHLAELRHSLADAAQAEDRQGLAMQIAPQTLLPLAGAQGIGFGHEVAGGGHDQCPGQFRRSMLVAVGAAHLDAQRRRSLEVEGGVAHAAGHQQLQSGQASQQVFVESRTFTHHANHFERFQALGQGVVIGRVVVDETHLADVFQFRPVNHVARYVLPIVDHCNLHRHQPYLFNARGWFCSASRARPCGISPVLPSAGRGPGPGIPPVSTGE
ncbi:hypothetical protein D3C84_703400 [compost metagenome]